MAKNKSNKWERAPYLRHKENRLINQHRLAPSIKAGLLRIARDENKSMSWILEQVIIDYFDLDKPKYYKRKDK